MIRTLPLAVALAAALTLATSSSLLAQGTPEPEAGIAPVVWRWTTLVAADGTETAIADPTLYTLQLLPDGAAVRADCNRGGGGYLIEGTKLTIGPFALTLAACEGDSRGIEFVQLLETTASFAYQEEALVLTLSDGGSMHLVPSLVGVVWEWREFLGGNDERIAPDDPSRYTLAFNDDGSFNLRADCNVGGGAYTFDGATIDLTVGALTRAACPPGSLSERFLADLDAVTSHVFREGRLYLALFADAGISEFTARVAEPEATPTAG